MSCAMMSYVWTNDCCCRPVEIEPQMEYAPASNSAYLCQELCSIMLGCIDLSYVEGGLPIHESIIQDASSMHVAVNHLMSASSFCDVCYFLCAAHITPEGTESSPALVEDEIHTSDLSAKQTFVVPANDTLTMKSVPIQGVGPLLKVFCRHFSCGAWPIAFPIHRKSIIRHLFNHKDAMLERVFGDQRRASRQSIF